MDLFCDFSIISWNIRGALGQSTRRHLRDVISQHHPSLFLLYETHGLFVKVEAFWENLGYKPLFLQEANGHSGGIWILSCVNDITVSLTDSIHQAISFSIQKRNVARHCSAIYASPTPSNRNFLWDYLSDLRNQISGPWLLLGDFNEILNPNEVFRGNFSSSRAYLLANMMSACGVMDLDSVGGWFTWRKNVQSGGHVRKKLDRCMADSEWRVLFPHALLEVLPMHNSYHNPLLLSCLKSRSKRVKSFHFQATWLSHPEYPNLVTNTWNSTQGNVYNKLHKVQVESTKFNEKVFGNIFKRKRHLDARIKGVHKKLDIFPYSGLIILERKLQALYNQVLHQEEVLWFQKSRE